MTKPLQSPQAGGGLLPCPFCGGVPESFWGGPGNYFIECQTCGAQSDDGSEERIIAAWNRRASTPAPSGLAGEAVAKVVERVTNRAESLERIGATEDAADLRALLSALADAVPPSIPAGGVREALRETIRTIVDDALNSAIPEPWEIADHATNRILASLSLPAGGVRWLPIEFADKSIATVQKFGDVVLRNSYPIWARDNDGRTYEAVWNDHKQGYWWDLEAESPVDPVEFAPHPLSPEYASSLSLPAGGVAVSDAWQGMETAPKDGTYVLLWMVHQNAKYSADPVEEGWEAPVVAKWIDHNGGGWTWHGLCGQPARWMPFPMLEAALSPEAKTGERS